MNNFTEIPDKTLKAFAKKKQKELDSLLEFVEANQKREWLELIENPPTHGDYVRVITGGFVQAYCLAGLVCDINPPESIITKGTYQRLSSETKNPLGLSLTKLCRGIELKQIDTTESAFNTTIDKYRHVPIAQAVKWLENEKIKVSKRLKQYVAENIFEAKTVGRGKPKGVGAVDDSASLEKIREVMTEYETKNKKRMPVKSACESVAVDMKIHERAHNATVDRWRRKIRDLNKGQ